MKKKIKFPIVAKLFLGFGTILIAIFITSYYTYRTLSKNLAISEEISTIYTPSASSLNDLLSMITESKMLIKIWVYDDSAVKSLDKVRLEKIHSEQYPKLKQKIDALVENWDGMNISVSEQEDTLLENGKKFKIENIYFDENDTIASQLENTNNKHYWTGKDVDYYNKICKSIDTLFTEHKGTMAILGEISSYKNTMSVIIADENIYKGNKIMTLSNRIILELTAMVNHQQEIVTNKNAEMDKSFDDFQLIIILMALILTISVILIGIVTAQTLVQPINYLKGIIQSMGRGKLPDEEVSSRSDEIGEMSDALNDLVNGLKRTSEFSLEIGKGNYQSKFKPLSEDDVLGTSILLMRDNLKKAAEEAEQRKKENFQRNWSSQGIALFGEILRKNTDNNEEFAYSIISNLVRYLDANQGGLFTINDKNKDEIFIELVACYAYNRKKHLEKRIEVGVNVVGQCVQERETIYMTDLPHSYINISSGLGDDNPRSLLVVPLITSEEVFGVVEIASFKSIEPYQIEFIEKVGETIAATLLSVKINNQTAKLLSESQDKSERLARQEEEMRQNIEEMQATQEDLIEQDQKKYDNIRNEYEVKANEYKSQIVELQKNLQKLDRGKKQANPYDN